MATMTTADAAQAVAEMVRDRLLLIPGARPYDVERVVEIAKGRQMAERVSVEWERGWGIGCSLEVSLRNKRRSDVRVGWSSTGRTPAEAVAAAALYAQVAALACEIEAFLARTDVVEL